MFGGDRSVPDFLGAIDRGLGWRVDALLRVTHPTDDVWGIYGEFMGNLWGIYGMGVA